MIKNFVNYIKIINEIKAKKSGLKSHKSFSPSYFRIINSLTL